MFYANMNTNLTSIYIHWEQANHLHWKTKSFNEQFWTIWIPWDITPFEAIDYFENNLIHLDNIIIIASSAWAMSALEVERKYSNKIYKIILFNPAVVINTIKTKCKTRIYLWKPDGWSKWIYYSNPNIELIEIDWDHSFSWKERELNEIIKNELYTT